MLFTCAPATPAGPATGAMRRKGNCPCIDIHCHYHNHDLVKKYGHLDRSAIPYKNTFINKETQRISALNEREIVPKMVDVDVRLAEMDRLGIDIQAIAPATEQYYYWTEPELGRQISREVNEGIAEMVSRAPDRLVGLGTLPLQNPEFAVAELERIVKDLGLRGVEIGSNVNGLTLSDPALGLEPVFAKLEELDVLAFIHPRPFNGGARLGEYHMSNTIGQPLDSTVTITHLIFSGVLERHPDLKLCVAHAGGYLPFYPGRMDHAYDVRPDCQVLKESPSSYLKKLYFDTMTFDAGTLGWLAERYGADHILLGTDYPYDMALPDPVGLIDATPGLSAAERDQMKGGNAARLLKLDLAQFARKSSAG